MEYIIDEKNKKKAILLPLEEYESLKKEINYYKKIIEELQDEIDSFEAENIRNESKGTVKFQLSEYVSDRNRTSGSKSIKKTIGKRPGKARKTYS